MQKSNENILQAIDLHNKLELFSLILKQFQGKEDMAKKKKIDIEISAVNNSEVVTNCDHLKSYTTRDPKEIAKLLATIRKIE